MFIKTCCIKNRDEAELARKAGANAIGLVSAMPSGPGVISEDVIAELAAEYRGRLDTFLLTSLTGAEQIARQHARCSTSTIQLCDTLTDAQWRKLRAALDGPVKLVGVLHVWDETALAEARRVAQFADWLLLDSGRPADAQKTLGGTGQTHNWQISRRIVQTIKKPVLLAGGLNPSNVRNALREVQPFGVDICSGIRSNDRLDPLKLSAFADAVSKFSGRS